MDVSSFWFIAILILLGGVIALFGDRLGRRLGKKRITLGKLRPRHTAELITVLAGILIPLVTVGLILLVSADLRRLFTQGRAAIAEAETLRVTRDNLNREVANRQADLERISKNLNLQTEAVKRQTEAARRAEARAAGLSKRSEELLRRVGALQSRVEGLNRSFRSLEVANRKAAADLRTARGATVRAQSAFDQLRVLNNNANEYNIQLDQANQRLERERATLVEESRKLQTEITGVQAELVGLRELVATTRTEAAEALRDKELELERAAVALQVRQNQLKELEREIEVLRGIFGNSRTQALTYRIGEEVTRIQIATSGSAEEARTHLIRLLRAARVAAEARGARGTRNVPSAGIFERIQEGRPISTEEQLSRMAQAVVNLRQPVVLVATSSLNAFAGEPVSLDVSWFRNPTVYRVGEVISETRIDGDLQEDQVFGLLRGFLNGAVRDAALKAGYVPLRGENGDFGGLSILTLAQTVREIRDMRRLVRIQAVARQETRAGDELRVELRLR